MKQTSIDSAEAHVPLEVLKRSRVLTPTTTDMAGAEEEDAFSHIRCPRCAWRPSVASRWACYCLGTPEPPFDACGTVWNTFSTGGRCPGCHHQWRWTSCLRCGEWSLHVDWYVSKTED